MLELQIFEEKMDSGALDWAEMEVAFRDFMSDIGSYMASRLRHHVPLGATWRTFRNIYEDDVEKTPYGYSVDVGIHPIEDVQQGESPIYPLFVHEGTGMFSDNPHWIVPQHGNVMVFEDLRHGIEGGPSSIVFTRSVEGQEAQPYMDIVEEETGVYVELKKRELAAIINNM